MRGPARIKRILDKLNIYWNYKENQDLRLCQIILNFHRQTNEIQERHSDLFYLQDEIFEEWLDKELEK